MKDLVSVIVPVYNSQKWLPKCIESILNQSYKNIEIILVNDGSTDGSLSVCNKYAKKYNNIVVFDKKNEGVSVARNIGIDNSNGEYIMFVDSDDWIPKCSIEILLTEIRKNNSDLSIGTISNITVFSNNKPFKNLKKLCVNKQDSYMWFCYYRQCDWGPCAKIFKKSIIKDNDLKFPTGIKSGEDSIFIARYLNCCKKVCSTDEIVYYYNRLNENSAIGKYYADFNKWMIVLLSEIISAFSIEGCSDCDKYISFFAIDLFDNTCKNYVKCASKEEALLKLEESFSMFSKYVNSEMILPEEAKRAQKKKEYFDEFFKDNDFDKLYGKLKNTYKSSNDSKIKNILKRIKKGFVIANKKYLT